MSTNEPNEWIDKAWRLCCLLTALAGCTLPFAILGKELWIAIGSGIALCLAVVGLIVLQKKRRRRDHLAERLRNIDKY